MSGGGDARWFPAGPAGPSPRVITAVAVTGGLPAVPPSFLNQRATGRRTRPSQGMLTAVCGNRI